MNDPFFSIIIPTFNSANVLGRCINSVLHQSSQTFALLVVANDSADNTTQVVNSILDNRITLIINPKNLERCESRNIGVEKAKGTHTCFLDSDDYFLDNHLENFTRHMNKQYHFYISNNIIYNEINSQKTLKSSETYTGLGYFLKHAILPSQVCILSRTLKKFKFHNDYLIVEDTVLWMQIAFNHKVKILTEPSVVYVLHENNSVNIKYNVYLKRLKGLKLFFKRHRKIAKRIGTKTISEAYNRCYLGIFEYYKYKNQKFRQIHVLLLALLMYPSITTKHKLKLLTGLLTLRESAFN